MCWYMEYYLMISGMSYEVSISCFPAAVAMVINFCSLLVSLALAAKTDLNSCNVNKKIDWLIDWLKNGFTPYCQYFSQEKWLHMYDTVISKTSSNVNWILDQTGVVWLVHWLIVYSFTSRWKTFHSYRYVNNAGEGL